VFLLIKLFFLKEKFGYIQNKQKFAFVVKKSLELKKFH